MKYVRLRLADGGTTADKRGGFCLFLTAGLVGGIITNNNKT